MFASTSYGFIGIPIKLTSCDFGSNMEISEGYWAYKTGDRLLLFVNWL